MLNIRQLREQPEHVKERLSTRGENPEVVDLVLSKDNSRRELVQQTETLKARRNVISKEIPQKAKAKEPIDELKAESKKLGEDISRIDEELKGIDDDLKDALLRLPNLPDESVPVGADESANLEIRRWGDPIKHQFGSKPHWELGESLGFLDLARGANLSGSGFYVLKGVGSRLERVLIQWLLDFNTVKHGYTEVSVPFVVRDEALLGTSQLPKFDDQLYHIPEDELRLIPTAEVPVTNLHANEILDGEQLPLAYCAHTPCFRREAGAAGRENRGISRVHQFHKVELVHITLPEESEETHEKLTANACALLEALNVPYRVLELCTGDLGFGARKCYDLEVWAPGMDTWLEVSSCSNFGDFQARRAGIRFRREKQGKPEFVHTLNGSGLALPRLMIALLENNQNEDGSITVPEPLRERLMCDVIKRD